jgi:ubiquinone/menaquinone biosynthesis C-methylase UbiE
MPDSNMIKKGIEQIFDAAAESYDRVGPSIFTQFGNRLVEKLPLVTGAKVLDVATGKGAALIPVAQRVGPTGHVVGIDLSQGILHELEGTLDKIGLTNAELRKMDAEHLDFPDQTFDFVTCAFALFLFPDMKGALSEMFRVCKPGGCISLTFFGKPMFSPGFPILAQQFMAYGIELRMPNPIAYLPDEVKALLSLFNSVEIHAETNDIVYSSMDDIWAFLLTLPTRSPIMGMNEDIRTRFKNEFFTKLLPMVRPDGLHASAHVIYAIAKR